MIFIDGTIKGPKITPVSRSDQMPQDLGKVDN